MLRKAPLVTGEAYHIYNRGAHKQAIFTNEADYRRFLIILHLCNDSEASNISDLLGTKKYRERFSGDIFLEERDKSLVDILAYTLMSNHFHLVLRQKSDEGISRFMRKVGVAYSMYFNTRYEHSGVLFEGRFRSSHLDSEPYFRWIFPYVHLNPLSLLEQNWEEAGVSDVQDAELFLRDYPYSSYYDYYVGERQERAILAHSEAKDFVDSEADIHALLTSFTERREMYRDVHNETQ